MPAASETFFWSFHHQMTFCHRYYSELYFVYLMKLVTRQRNIILVNQRLFIPSLYIVIVDLYIMNYYLIHQSVTIQTSSGF